jgi:nucleotide-binding universal stress UspA family protein
MMRMLVATDGSPHALKAAELAARLARELLGANDGLLMPRVASPRPTATR